MSKIIAVANQKGGVAKTTSTGAIAAGLRLRGFPVLAIDIDPQGNLSDSVNANIISAPTIYELLRREADAADVVQKLDVFDIIPANIMLAGMEQELLSQTGKEHRLSEVVSPIAHQYDYILIDTPPSLGVLTINALTFADEVLVPTTAGIFATQGIKQLSDTVENVKKYCNSKIHIKGILLTRYNPRAIISQDIKELTESLATHIKAPIFNSYIRNSIVVEEAQANKLDIFAYKGKSTVADDYSAFIDEYLQGGANA